MKLFSPLRLLLLSCTLSGVIALLISLQNQEPPQSSSSLQATVVDESMTAVKAKRFKKGILSQTLILQTWTKHKGENVIHFEKPTLITFQSNGSQWQISSHHGKGYQLQPGKFENLVLEQDVLISSLNKQKQQEWTLLTDFLDYNPSTKMATTSHDVTICGPEINMKAKGMMADLNQYTVKFIAKVNALYAAQKI